MILAPVMALPPADALLQDPEFRELKRWVIATTGLSYYADKDRDLANAILKSQSGVDKPAGEILKSLSRTGSLSMDRLVEELTIGETFFFRHLEMFHALRDHVFPDLLRRRAGLRSLRIWSAGCSVGAEPYSIAMQLLELLGAEAANWKIDIIATDINRRFLALARAGVYDAWALRGMPQKILDARFQKVGARWMVEESCRKLVRFRHHNLVSDKFPSVENELSGLDLIICRNVTIYFDGDTIRRLTEQFFRSLVPGGWLAVGHAEPHMDTFRAFHTVNAPGAILYQRPDEGQPATQVHTRKEAEWVPPALLFPPPQVPVPALPKTPGGKPTPAPLVPRLLRSELPPVAPLNASPAAAILDPRRQEIQRLADQGQLTEARRRCEELTHHSPLSGDAYCQLGLIHYQLGEWREAEKALKRCLYLNREAAVAHYYLGLVQLGLGQDGARSFKNAFKLVRLLPDTEIQPMADGMTAGELRMLLKPHLNQGESESP